MRCLTDHGPFGVRVEQGGVVVRLDEQRRRRANAFVDELGGEAEVRQITQRRRAVVEHVADRINRVVRHGEGLDRHVLDLEVAARSGTGASCGAYPGSCPRGGGFRR